MLRENRSFAISLVIPCHIKKKREKPFHSTLSFNECENKKMESWKENFSVTNRIWNDEPFKNFFLLNWLFHFSSLTSEAKKYRVLNYL